MNLRDQARLRKVTAAAGGGVYPLGSEGHSMACLGIAAPGWCPIALLEKNAARYASPVIDVVVEYVAVDEVIDSRLALWTVLKRAGVAYDSYVVATSMMRVTNEEHLVEDHCKDKTLRMRDMAGEVTHAFDDTIIFAKGSVDQVVDAISQVVIADLTVPARLYLESFAPESVTDSPEEMAEQLMAHLKTTLLSGEGRVQVHEPTGEMSHSEVIARWDPVDKLKSIYGHQ